MVKHFTNSYISYWKNNNYVISEWVDIPTYMYKRKKHMLNTPAMINILTRIFPCLIGVTEKSDKDIHATVTHISYIMPVSCCPLYRRNGKSTALAIVYIAFIKV